MSLGALIQSLFTAMRPSPGGLTLSYCTTVEESYIGLGCAPNTIVLLKTIQYPSPCQETALRG